jgi:GNAT superfamily N-acetyltransferase
VRIDEATADDLPELSRLLILNAGETEVSQSAIDAFAIDLAKWWADRDGAHVAYVARSEGPELVGLVGLVGMAWLALVPRVPRPGTTNRMSADIQSVFVVPEARGNGIGSALVKAATEHAFHQGALRVTVHSSRRAVTVYERLGFTVSPQLLQQPPDN